MCDLWSYFYMKKYFILFLNIFLYVFAGIMIFQFLSPMYHALVVWGESLVWHWWGPTNTVQFFKNSDHSWFILSMFWSMGARYLPEFLKMHPQVWASNFNFWALFIGMLLVQLSILDNFTKYFSRKNFRILWLFLIFPLYCSFLNAADASWILADDCWSYAYIIIPVFSIVLFSEVEKFYIKNDFKNASKFHKVILFLLFLCVAVSHEFTRFILCSSLFIGYFLHILFVNRKINHKKFWLIATFVVLASVINFASQRFQWWIETKLNSSNFILHSLLNYFSGFYQNVLLDNKFQILAILILIAIALMFTPKNAERKKLIVFTSAMTVSIFLFSLIIIIGQEFQYFAFNHCGVKFLTKMYLFNVILSLIGWLIVNIKLNSIKVYTVILTFLMLYFGAKPITFIDREMIESNYNIQRRIYILERIFSLYSRQNKVFLDCQDLETFIPHYSLIYFIYLYDRGADFYDYEQVKFCLNGETYEECNKKLVDFLKDKTNYDLTEEEIEKQDFQKYYGY